MECEGKTTELCLKYIIGAKNSLFVVEFIMALSRIRATSQKSFIYFFPWFLISVDRILKCVLL